MATGRVVPVAAFTFVYIGIALVLGTERGNAEFLFYIAVMLVLMAMLWVVHRRIGLTAGALWGLSLWGLAHMAGGLLTVPTSWPTAEGSDVLYALWLVPERLKYDQVVHAYGFGVTTWVCWQGMRAAFRIDGDRLSPTLGRMVLSASAGLGFGALNEVVEFMATLLLPSTGVGGYVNTGWDLVANLVGATVAVALIWVFESEPNALATR